MQCFSWVSLRVGPFSETAGQLPAITTADKKGSTSDITFTAGEVNAIFLEQFHKSSSVSTY